MGISSSNNFTQLSKDDISLLSKKLNLKEEEIINAHDKFMAHFPKGQINKKEFIDYFGGQRPDRDSEVFCSQLFNAFDSDKNGKVDFNEFLFTISITSNNDVKQKLRVAFRMYDLDNDGKLNIKEIESLYRGIVCFYGKKLNQSELSPNEMALQLLVKFDKDKNSYITEEEFITGLGDLTIRAMETFSVLKNGFI